MIRTQKYGKLVLVITARLTAIPCQNWPSFNWNAVYSPAACQHTHRMLQECVWVSVLFTADNSRHQCSMLLQLSTRESSQWWRHAVRWTCGKTDRKTAWNAENAVDGRIASD